MVMLVDRKVLGEGEALTAGPVPLLSSPVVKDSSDEVLGTNVEANVSKVKAKQSTIFPCFNTISIEC